MTAQKWVFLLVTSEGQKLYRVDRNHPGCLLKAKEGGSCQHRFRLKEAWLPDSLSKCFPPSGHEMQIGSGGGRIILILLVQNF